MRNFPKLLICFIFSLSLLAQPEYAQANKGETDAQFFLRCLTHIVDAREFKSLKNLKTDDERMKYIENFWALRDPFPSTPANELRIVYETRCGQAEKEFRHGDGGASSDRGLIYILLGPPNERKLSQHTTATMQTDIAGHRVTESEKWTYYNIPFSSIGPNYTIEFVRLEGMPNFTLASKTDMLYGLYTAVSGMSSLKDVMDLSLVIQASIEPPPSQLTLENLLVKGEEKADFPISTNIVFLQSEDIAITSMLLTLQIETKGLSEADIPKLKVGARIISEEKAEEKPPEEIMFPAETAEEKAPTGYEYVELIPFARNNELKNVKYYQFPVPLNPGDYSLTVGALAENAEKHAVKKLAVSVPSFEAPYPKISTPILVQGGVKEVSVSERNMLKHSSGISPLVVGGHHLIVPKFSNTYKLKDRLAVYCQIYNFQTAGTQKNSPYNVELVRSLKAAGWESFKTFPVEVVAKDNVGNSWWLDASLEKYPAGLYRFEIVVKDAANPDKKNSKTIEFEIIPD